MQAKTFVLNWSALNIPDAVVVSRLRLCSGTGGTLLFSAVTRAQNAFDYETVLSATAVNGSPLLPAPFAIHQLLPPPPQWDVQRIEEGTFHIVIEQAGGAINALGLLKWRGDVVAMSARYPFDSFHSPRFGRHGKGAASQAITSVVNARHLVVFTARAGIYGAYTPLCDADAGVILPAAGGFILFYKEVIPGLVRGNDIAPGRLHCQRLSMDFQPLGVSIKPLGDTTIFEFDADDNGRESSIFATTKAGFVLASGTATNAAFIRSAYSETPYHATLTRPCLVTDNRVLRLAALEAEQTPQARVIVSAAAIA